MPRIAGKIAAVAASWLIIALQADDLFLQWDPPNFGEDVAGYRLHIETEEQIYPPIDLGPLTEYDIHDLSPQNSYLIFVTSYNSFGLESDASSIRQFPEDAGCIVSANPRSVSLSKGQQTGSFLVTAMAQCLWSPVAADSWISIERMEPAGGQTRVFYSVERNTGVEPREGTISIGTSRYSIYQSGEPLLPVIVEHLSGTTGVKERGLLRLAIHVEADEDVRLQWFKDGNALAGATNEVYSARNEGTNVFGTYRIDVSNPAGTIQEGPLQVGPYEAAILKEGPATQLVSIGDSVDFSVTASGSDLQYSWFKDGSLLTNDTAVFHLSTVRSSDLGLYYAIVYNDLGSTATPPAYLTTREFEQQLGRIHLNAREDGSLLVQGEGIPGETYDIEVSNDLILWRRIDSVVAAEGGLFTVDTPSPTGNAPAQWFVRTVRQPHVNFD